MIKISMESRRLKRHRSENWTQEETDLLQSLIDERFDIIDKKSADGPTNARKSQAWKEIWERFVTHNPRPRTLKNLRIKWKKMKNTRRMTTEGLNDDGDSMGDDHRPSESSQPSLENTFIELGNSRENGGSTASTTTTTTNTNTTTAQQRRYKESQYAGGGGDAPASGGGGARAPRLLTTRAYIAPNGLLDYKKSLLELNRVVKEQIANCALEEHEERSRRQREEHAASEGRARELHALRCENERLRAELLRLEIELKRRELDNCSAEQQ